ncbi:MAG: type II toxin-antitoxin system VapC family toxin [Caldilineaceae bacterium]|nr:type II toxin-antitoxin system VapC family toxin [Caldilineaceae bacterium]
MAAYFFDSSALVKRYIVEAGAAYVNSALTDRLASRFIAHLTLAEVTAAMVRRLTSDAAAAAIARFVLDIDLVLLTVNMDNELVEDAVALIQLHKLRGCDALQLAAALRVFASGYYPDLVFVCAGDELNRAAVAEGLAAENPNRYP